MVEHGGVVLADTREMTEEEWLLARKAGIGGSDIAAILGLSKWGSPLTVWHDKTTMNLDREQSLAAELGKELEPFLCRKLQEWLRENEGIEVDVEPMPFMLQHPEHPIVMANLDAALWHPGDVTWCDIECKSAGEYARQEWGEGELPDAYYAQVQWQLGVTGWERAYVPFIIGNRHFDVRVVPRNEDVIAGLIAAAELFWNEFVLTGTPPAPTSLAADKEVLQLLYPVADGEIVSLEHMADDYSIYKDCAAKRKVLEAQMDAVKHRFMAALGTAEVGVVGTNRVTWKTVERKEHMVKASSSRQLRVL